LPSTQFIDSLAANIAYWRGHDGLSDPRAWPALDRERGNLFRAVEFGLRHEETWPAAAELALACYTYVFERGYWGEWAPVLEKLLSASPDQDSTVRGRVYHHLGNFYRRLRRLDEAQAAHEQTEALGQLLDDGLLLALAHLGLGRVYMRRRQYAEAKQYARLALAGFEARSTGLRLPANARNLLGIIALERGDNEDARREFYQARDLFCQAQLPIEQARTNVNLCQALTRLGCAEEALELFEEAAAIFTEHDLHTERSRAYMSLGFLRYTQDDLPQAEAAFRRAYTPAMRRAGPIYLRSMIEMNLGNVLLQQGRREEARNYFLSAVAGFRLVNAQTMLANSLDGLAEITLAAGNRQEAIDLYEEALAIVTPIPENAFAQRMEKRFRGLLAELSLAPDEEE
jgi:tetratricopeptide (TPR) repeat protein